MIELIVLIKVLAVLIVVLFILISALRKAYEDGWNDRGNADLPQVLHRDIHVHPFPVRQRK